MDSTSDGARVDVSPPLISVDPEDANRREHAIAVQNTSDFTVTDTPVSASASECGSVKRQRNSDTDSDEKKTIDIEAQERGSEEAEDQQDAVELQSRNNQGSGAYDVPTSNVDADDADMLTENTEEYESKDEENSATDEIDSANDTPNDTPPKRRNGSIEDDAERKEGLDDNTPLDEGAVTAIERDNDSGEKPVTTASNTEAVGSEHVADTVDNSIGSLRRMIQERGLDTTSLDQWSVRSDGKLVDASGKKYRDVQDAFRAYTFALTGMIPREDIYFLAILRRTLAEQELPLHDGPISVLSLGKVVPEPLFYSAKKLFPIGYETLVNVQVTKPTTLSFRLRCKIVHGNKKKSPIFVVEMEKTTDIVFRSYVASKAWKKALAHFENLTTEELTALIGDYEMYPSTEANDSREYLSIASSEDGFGLLRRNVTRVLEGLPQVLKCKDYQFWEERHPVTADVHTKLRSRLKAQVKTSLKAQDSFSKEDIKQIISQEVALHIHSQDPDELARIQLQKDKEKREAEKRSVREAARKLLEIEMKAQEDAKEAQRREKEEKKNAILEAKMEALRQKEARKEASRLAKEEERRMREEEKEMKRALKEEEKRKKLEEKENLMKRRIEELRQRRKMREEQRSILENGVVTTSSHAQPVAVSGNDSVETSDCNEPAAHRGIESSATTPSGSAKTSGSSIRQQRLALLKFVEEEKDRRRRIRIWEKKNHVEKCIWTSVKSRYQRDVKCTDKLSCSDDETTNSGGSIDQSVENLNKKSSSFPQNIICSSKELDLVPEELQADLLFIWDFISTFADCLRLTVVPSLGIFAKMMALSDGSSPVGDGALEDGSLGQLFAGIHAELIKVLVAEYFPVLQMGTRLDEFYRTRPLNIFSWPELARQVCLLFIEVKHPSPDEQILKSLKGSKSYRDDSVVIPVRQKLQRRGLHLLTGVQYEERSSDLNSSLPLEKNTDMTTDVVNANSSSAMSAYYGVVIPDGISSRIEVTERDGHLVIKNVADVSNTTDPNTAADESKPSDATNDDGNDNVGSMKVGDYLVSINGQNVKTMTMSEFNTLLETLPPPHGVLLSSSIPQTKVSLKHIPTTTSSSLLKRCAHVLKILRAKEISSPFNQPVDAELYPDYYSSGIIAEPMDLGTIAEKLEDEDYENDDVESFVEDVALVWKNCYTYNSVKAEISNLARKLSAIFDRLMNEWVYTTVTRPLIASEEDFCRNCQTNHVKDRLLLCDRCDAPYHTFCLASPLSKVPTEEWFCPACVKDPEFSPDLFRRRPSDAVGVGKENGTLQDQDFTEFEKRVQTVIELLSKENYAELAIDERLNILKVLCELVQGTAVVQSIYHSLEEKANEARRDFGDALADLRREWDHFSPPRSNHGIERTNKFFIDGVEHELTDELLQYLGDKATAELENRPIPTLPTSALHRLHHQYHDVETIFGSEVPESLTEPNDSTSDDSDSDEDHLLEKFGDDFLCTFVQKVEPTIPRPDIGNDVQSNSSCMFCGLEDGILNGSLHVCKVSPLTHQVTELRQYEIPEFLAGESHATFRVESIVDNNLLNINIAPVPEGAQLRKHQNRAGMDISHVPFPNQNGGMDQQIRMDMDATKQEEMTEDVIYAVNDRVVHGMDLNKVMEVIQNADKPALIYSTTLPGEALKASVSIVKYYSIPLALDFDIFESYIFVQSYQSSPEVPVGFGELCGQIFPGDILLMVNEISTTGMDLPELLELLRADSSIVKYLVFARPPCGDMKALVKQWQRISNDNTIQRSIQDKIRAEMIENTQGNGANDRYYYEVTFHDGPLGLALSLEDKGVIVKSLNDHSNGMLSQASLSRQIRPGDLVETVNGEVYGPLRDLSQFTSALLRLPRPLVIGFSRDIKLSNLNQVDAMNEVSKKSSTSYLELIGDSSRLRRSLDLPPKSEVKTFRVLAFPFPFVVAEFVNSLRVIAINGTVHCESVELKHNSGQQDECATSVINVGDRIVGLNGKPLSGLSWLSVQTLCRDLLAGTPLYLHLVPHIRQATLLMAHTHCAQAANMAWSECEYLASKLQKARRLETFLNWMVVPRTLPLGRCRSGFTYYRFFGDRQRVYLVSSEKKWFSIQQKVHFTNLLSYLEANSRDLVIATRIRACFHLILHGDTSIKLSVPSHKVTSASGSASAKLCCEFSDVSFLQSGPFAVRREIILSVSESEMESHEASLTYCGRKFYVGTFSTRDQAEKALQIAEAGMYSTGLHIAPASDVSSLVAARFPSLDVPVLKAETVVRRNLARKYEYGSVLDTSGRPRGIPLSQSVYHTLRRGLKFGSSSMPQNSMLEPSRAYYHEVNNNKGRMSNVSSQLSSNAYEQMKRKRSQYDNIEMSMYQNFDQLKRSKQHVGNVSQQLLQSSAAHPSTRVSPGHATEGNGSVLFKRSLQSLGDQGRAMLSAWNQFATSPNVAASNGLAFACLSSFEEVKKAVSRIIVDRNGPLPDPKTFVCLHHAYVIGLICAMTTQALTRSRKTTGDSAFAKLIADAFATAILSCMDPSTMLRTRALHGFAIAAKHCEHSVRPSDLSDELHHVANFILQFLRTTQYLAEGNFEDMTRCRSILPPLNRGMETLPASFFQQIKLLDSIRESYSQRTARLSSVASRKLPGPTAKSSPHGMAHLSPSVSVGAGSSGPNVANGTFINVDFGKGPLGIVINYSSRGTIVVTEFSNDSGMMGQAQASGKVLIGDEVYAVNGDRLEVIGMEGFKMAVATAARPLRVTFRRLSSIARAPYVASARSNTSTTGLPLRQQTQNTVPVLKYPQGIPTAPQNQYSASSARDAMYSPSPLPGVMNGYFNGQQGTAMAMPTENMNRAYQQQNVNAYPDNEIDINPIPFQASAPQSSGAGNDGKIPSYGMAAPSTLGPYADNMSVPYPAAPNDNNYGVLPNIFDSNAALPPPTEWQAPASAAMNYGVGRPIASVSTYSSNPTTGELNGPTSMPQQMNPSQYPTTSMSFATASSLVPNASQDSTGSYMGNSSSDYVQFVAPNDQTNVQPNSNQLTFYDANDTTFRGVSGFEVDTSTLTGAASGASQTAQDVETEPESPSVSQLTTPAQSDTEGEGGSKGTSLMREAQLMRLRAVSNALETSIATTHSAQTPIISMNTTNGIHTSANPNVGSAPYSSSSITESVPIPVNEQEVTLGSRDNHDVDTAEGTGARRSSRVSRKITTNIADLYDPELAKSSQLKSGTGRINNKIVEPTSGEVGELATELLEPFQVTIRPLKSDIPYALSLLRAQLLTVEAAMPRDAFRTGRWIRSIRAAWAEMVYSCDSAAMLLEAILFLESNIEAEWLDPCWKASPLQTARNALASATIASAAMRLYALDDAVAYVRVKRSGKRKQKAPSIVSTSRPSSPANGAISSSPITHPSELPFMNMLSSGTIALANKIINRIVAGVRDKTMSAYMQRKAKSELSAITSLSDEQIDQWVKVCVSQAQQQPLRGLAVMTSQSTQGAVASRQATPKRKNPGAQVSPSGQPPTRKRKNARSGGSSSGQHQRVELRCFQMKTTTYQFHTGVLDATLSSRLEHIMTTLLRNELALPFAQPVNPNDVPGYTDIIKTSMDLGTIKTRLTRGYYEQRYQLFISDVNLVWTNCFTFNRLDSEISKCANRLKSIFNRLFEQWISDIPPGTPVAQLPTEEQCRQCQQDNATDSMLLCDSCDAAYHIFCLNPPLSAIPPGNWYCPRCPLQQVTM